ncbi:MAG: YVTN family beta-propeller domain-containing protein [Acidobacteria bacterium]|nr:MAG: YVTN family beta-propeller domain-containing protein [Acidobacteriota bacterium]
MKTIFAGIHCLLVAAVVSLLATPVVAADSDSHQPDNVRRLAPGGDGRWDYIVVDPATNRLYITRSTRVMVVDAESGKTLAEIADTAGVHGVALAPDLGVGFTSNGKENKVSVFDLKTFKELKKIETGQNPDSILYHAPTHQVFVFNGTSHDATVIDAAKQSVIATIPLAGRPEFSVADDSGNIYFNIEDKNSLGVIDAAQRKVKNVWSLGNCEEPTGLAVDVKTQTAFSACANKQLAVFDLKNGKVVQTVPIGDDCDAVAYDPATGNIIASNGEGTLTIIHKGGNGKYAVSNTVTTQPGSKTMALDAEHHRVYVPAAKFTGNPTARPRPQMVAGSFEVLVVPE